MADKIPVKAVISGGAAVGLAEYATGDTVPVPNGGTGLSAATLADLITALGGSTTGAFLYFQRAAAPAGWVVANGGTIGSASSGATRANADTQNLFTAWWTDYSDAQLPILTSAGGASTRGASAAADWAANKRLTVFDLTDDRVPVSANGSGTINGTKYADQFQGHGHAASGNVNGVVTGSSYNAFVVTNVNSTEDLSTRLGIAAPTTLGANGTPRIGTKTLPPRIGMLGCYKL
jgi:hypothetical protein